MKLEFKPSVKNRRYFKQYLCVQLDYNQPNYWWDETLKKWTLNPNWSEDIVSNTFSYCYSVRAFKRRLKEWSKYIPIGTKFRLVGRFVGQDVIGIIK